MMIVSASRVSAEIAARITNWYFAASNGSPPAMTCPAIMPGIVTMPLDAKEAVVGNRPSLNEETIDGRAASHVVAPNASIIWTSSRRSRMLSKNRVNPTASADTEFPSSMPVSGTTSCGEYHGVGRTISSATSVSISSIVMTNANSTGPAMPRGTPLARDSVICTPAPSMTTISSATSQGLSARITNPMISPIAHSCSNARQADHSSVRPMPSRIRHDTAAAATTISMAASSPQTSMG